jgi:hypothetical protein
MPLEAIHACDVLVTVVRYDVCVMLGETLARLYRKAELQTDADHHPYTNV